MPDEYFQSCNHRRISLNTGEEKFFLGNSGRVCGGRSRWPDFSGFGKTGVLERKQKRNFENTFEPLETRAAHLRFTEDTDSVSQLVDQKEEGQQTLTPRRSVSVPVLPGTPVEKGRNAHVHDTPPKTFSDTALEVNEKSMKNLKKQKTAKKSKPSKTKENLSVALFPASSSEIKESPFHIENGNIDTTSRQSSLGHIIAKALGRPASSSCTDRVAKLKIKFSKIFKNFLGVSRISEDFIEVSRISKDVLEFLVWLLYV